ncbi:MAG: FG-GAP repeat domain-containing protein, partial [Desulfomonilaceae bacterium]
TGERETIVLLPFRLTTETDDPGLQSFVDHINDELRSAIRAMGGRYQVVEWEGDQQSDRAEQSLDDDRGLRKVAQNAGADFVICGSIGTSDSLYHMKGLMWDAKKERMAVRVDLKVPNVHALPSVLQFLLAGITKRLQGAPNIPFYKAGEPGSMPAVHQPRFRTVIGVAETEGPWRSPELPGSITGLAIGDLDGDRHNELVLVGDSGITIARFEKNALRPLTQFSKSPAVFLSAQAQDLDGDGVPELIVCSQLPDGVESEVLRYLNRNLTVVETFPNMILCCVPAPENPKVMNLLGQQTDAGDMFSGEMISFSLRDGALKRQGKVTLPQGTLLLSYAAGDIQGHAHVRVLIDQRLKLRVFDQDNQLLSVQDGHEYGPHRKVTVKTADGVKEIIWPGRIIISDSSPSGQGELMLAKTAGGKSEIQGFHWGGAFLEKKWNTPPMEGAILDFKIGDFKNNGARSLVLLLARPDQLLGMSGPRTILFAYDFLP